ncbi:hypothetical protein JQS43_10970 [Natronosporangium hydrolyticum]|uniref:Uncharacterized protein n=1 Tax=Natronosporangium hydrolyticum TaxID=2811111 RepID=A0A895YRV3_9ACTN|nr:hypothetical protein [Natronosporangium hydrolyticum]QSB16748.1 hypothetical protein JQS43_10970 [Natronosporangium hydrolyticum]
MSNNPLTTVETSALLILMAEAGPVSNVSLGRDHRCHLAKASREKLERLKLIEVERSPRLVLTLSDKGWARVRAQLEVGATLPRSGSVGGALAAVLRRWDRFLSAQRLSLDEFVTASNVTIGEAPAAAASELAPGRGEPEIEERLAKAYQLLAPHAGDLVSLADLRDQVGEVPPAEVDAALRRLHRRRGVALVPEANQKTLDARARAAAVVIGDQPKHAIAMAAS